MKINRNYVHKKFHSEFKIVSLTMDNVDQNFTSIRIKIAIDDNWTRIFICFFLYYTSTSPSSTTASCFSWIYASKSSHPPIKLTAALGSKISPSKQQGHVLCAANLSPETRDIEASFCSFNHARNCRLPHPLEALASKVPLNNFAYSSAAFTATGKKTHLAYPTTASQWQRRAMFCFWYPSQRSVLFFFSCCGAAKKSSAGLCLEREERREAWSSLPASTIQSLACKM